MITTRIVGGLGNQMFQYAAGRALALRNGDTLTIDRRAFANYAVHSYGLDAFVLEAHDAPSSAVYSLPCAATSWSRFLPWRPSVSRIVEAGFRFDPDVASSAGNLYLEGYWQSERYFSDATDTLRQDFRFRHDPTPANARLLRQASTDNSISIHVRRGDYVSNPSALAVHGTCSPLYYEEAVTMLASNCAIDMVGFIFSDDHCWTRENIKLPIEIVHVEGNAAQLAYEDMRIMAACRHHVIANSTFSWWGAWLDHRDDSQVIAPTKWFADASIDTVDLIPARWTRL